MVVFFANNTTTLLENAASLWQLADALRADVVAFDYRGYGFSAGTPSLRGMLDDAPRVAAFAHVIAERRGLRFAVVGQSLGTFPAGRAAAPPWVEELILIAPAASVSDLVEAVSHTLPWYRHAVVGASLEQVGIDPSTDIAATQAELLLIHSARDPLLPLASTQRLLQASKAPRRAICKAPASYGEMAPTNSGVRRCMLDFLHQEKRQASPAEPPQRSAGR
ncbi:MAG TPA: alpha/beta fold hydrolase [Polyangiaceae bacterium]|nr:alpha/beta fold hydrolase [Polyangiaceae bacterium]